MSDKEAKAIKKLLIITWGLMVALFVLILSAIVVYTAPSRDKSIVAVTGATGAKGADAVVNYPQIEDFITKQLSLIPNPQNGTNGANGADGTNGKDGVDGQDGLPGIPGKEIELRRDPETGNVEWRYVDEDFWTLLIDKCELVECGVQ